MKFFSVKFVFVWSGREFIKPVGKYFKGMNIIKEAERATKELVFLGVKLFMLAEKQACSVS